MATTSSLLKSAESTRKKIRAQQNAEAAYEWQQSAKTYQDFVDYSKFLEGQAEDAADPSEQLTYRKSVNSARSGYISNEIQRQTIAVMEGRATNLEKYGVMADLARQAYENGNYDLGQSLVSQLDSLSIRIQNEQEAAQRASQTMALNGVKTLGKLIRKFKEGDEIITLPDGTLVKPLSLLNDELKRKGQSAVAASGQKEADYFGELYRTAAIMQQLVNDAYTGAPNQEAADSIESNYSDIMTGDAGLVKVAGRDQMLNLQELDLAWRSAAANNPVYSITTGRDELTGETRYSLKKNKIDDFVWVYDDEGQARAIEVRSKVADPLQAISTTLTDDGRLVGKGQQDYDETRTIQNRLANLGYAVETNSDGTLSVTTPEGEIFDRATIMPDGTIRYFGEANDFSGGQAGLYTIDPYKGERRAVSPNEAPIFGIESSFGGLLSQPTKRGERVAMELANRGQSLTSSGIDALLGKDSGLELVSLAPKGQPTMSQYRDPTNILFASELMKSTKSGGGLNVISGGDLSGLSAPSPPPIAPAPKPSKVNIPSGALSPVSGPPTPGLSKKVPAFKPKPAVSSRDIQQGFESGGLKLL